MFDIKKVSKRSKSVSPPPHFMIIGLYSSCFGAVAVSYICNPPPPKSLQIYTPKTKEIVCALPLRLSHPTVLSYSSSNVVGGGFPPPSTVLLSVVDLQSLSVHTSPVNNTQLTLIHALFVESLCHFKGSEFQFLRQPIRQCFAQLFQNSLVNFIRNRSGRLKFQDLP